MRRSRVECSSSANDSKLMIDSSDDSISSRSAINSLMTFQFTAARGST
jgi:hypothetical protein